MRDLFRRLSSREMLAAVGVIGACATAVLQSGLLAEGSKGFAIAGMVVTACTMILARTWAQAKKPE